MPLTAKLRRSDQKPTLAQMFLVCELQAVARKMAGSAGVSPLRLLHWAYDQELSPARQAAGKKGGAKPKDWAMRTGIADPVDALMMIYICELLGSPVSRATFLKLMVKHVNGDNVLKRAEVDKRYKILKAFHEAPPVEIHSAFEARKSELPVDRVGRKAVLIALMDKYLAE